MNWTRDSQLRVRFKLRILSQMMKEKMCIVNQWIKLNSCPRSTRNSKGLSVSRILHSTAKQIVPPSISLGILHLDNLMISCQDQRMEYEILLRQTSSSSSFTWKMNGAPFIVGTKTRICCCLSFQIFMVSHLQREWGKRVTYEISWLRSGKVFLKRQKKKGCKGLQLESLKEGSLIYSLLFSTIRGLSSILECKEKVTKEMEPRVLTSLIIVDCFSICLVLLFSMSFSFLLTWLEVSKDGERKQWF
jgi:hypothetical protein